MHSIFKQISFRCFKYIFCLLIFLGCAEVFSQITVYVDSSRAASGVGTSWGTAFKTLAEAMHAVQGIA